MNEDIRPVLEGHKALVVGIANDQSIAYGCAKAFRLAGAEVAITWLNDRARTYVEPLARELGASITAPLDVGVPGQLEVVFDLIRKRWGKLDSLVHSIAFAPKQDLQGGLLDCSAEGFAKAMDFELLLNEAANKAPLGELVDIMDVGFSCAYLATPFARRITGGTIYVDGGVNVVA